MCIQAGNIGANDGGPKSPGSDPAPSSGDPAATGGDPAGTGGDPKATGSDPKATGSDPAAIDVLQGTHPDVAPLLNKFTCFGYQITSGMVSTRLMFIHQLHNSVIKSLKQQQSLPINIERDLETCITCSKYAQLSHTSSVFYSCVL